MRSATRENKKRRAKGDMVLAIKKSSIDGIGWKKSKSRELIGAYFRKRIEKYLIVIVYMNRERERNIKAIEKWIEEDLERKVIT